MFDKVTYDKLYKEVPAYKLITPAVVSERLKIRASLARKALEELEAKGLIKQVLKHEWVCQVDIHVECGELSEVRNCTGLSIACSSADTYPVL